ncbi:hypothetical protein [Amycolatopsis sulphurea]|nr:hypothetical protein [Amycolatopsis sulphurea]
MPRFAYCADHYAEVDFEVGGERRERERQQAVQLDLGPGHQHVLQCSHS